MNKDLELLKARGRELYLLEHTAALLGWDQETYIPARGDEERAEQLALLEGIQHEKLTGSRTGELFDRLGAGKDNPGGNPDLSPADRAYIRYFFHKYNRAICLPGELVTELARATSLGQTTWVKARKADDFSMFAPALKKVLDLTKKSAALMNPDGDPYDALLDGYEPGMTRKELEKVFSALKSELVSLVSRIAAAPAPDTEFLNRDFPQEAQEAFGRYILNEMNYPMDRGRMDVSAHPFTTTLGADDVRITTRYGEANPLSSLFSVIHEAGHGLYELGFAPEIRGNLLAAGTSLGVHESQSRTWENMIGRSRPFWTRYFPEAVRHFPAALKGVDFETFYKAVNSVKPSFIRVDADEVTYSLHVILRFELETMILDGKLEVEELPDVWNRKMEEFLGIRPSKDSLGVLQDVHWSAGLVGYFPTYALGNLYGAQFMNTARKEIPDLDSHVEKGDLGVLLSWLRSNIHAPGSSLTAGELCRKVTGEDLNPEYFSRYLSEKYGEVYEL